MMKRFFYTFLLGTAILLIGSCSTENESNFSFVPLQIVSAELPESFDLDHTYRISVTYMKPDGCTSFAGFDIVDKEVTTRNVVVIGTTRTDQEACTQAIVEETRTFDFIVLYNHTYVFRFWKGENTNGEQEYFEVEVPVN